ncbi:hypothetical protein 031MP004_39 [Bacillus phage 031MP004]|nr:hypothetical protein 031MP003_40 [Bacillus phage 031MP003]QFG05529.1 hypothetical protein 031MP002_39 [Bacillus phage 031MP002]QFG05616.1 hypothetical protein 031MP004_39 [Bacillus phage 031MP004]
MPKKTTSTKEKKKTLLEYNKGHKLRELKVGQTVPIYRIPYKAKGEAYKATVKKIIRMGALGATCLVEREGTGSESIEFIYLGKIYEGWDKPFG